MKYEVNPEVRRIIERKNFTEGEIARRSGISTTHLNNVLRGKANIGPATRARLMLALDLDFDELFHEVFE